MSFMRFGHELRWFNATSTEFIYGIIDKEGNPKLYDWRSAFDDPVQWIELVTRMLYRETRDMEFATYVARKLATDYGVADKLKDNPEW